MAFPTTGLLARYEAADIQESGGVLTGWNDSSGLARHITSVPNAPAVLTTALGRRVARCTSSNYFSVPTSVPINARSVSMYAVTRNPTGVNGMIISPGGGSVADFWISTGNTEFTAYDGTNKSAGFTYGKNRMLAGMRCGASDVKILADGEEATVAVLTAASTTGARINQFGASGLPMAGDYEALYFFDHQLTDPELADLRAYTVATYGVGSATKATYIIGEGDSLTVGFGLTPTYDKNWLAQLSAMFASEPKYDMVAGSGETVASMVTQAATQVDPKITAALSAGFADVVATLWAGTNDIANGTAAATIQSDIQTWHNARSASARTVCCTIIARGTLSGAQELVRQAVNAWLRANWASFADVFVDLAADSRLSNSANATYFDADTIHLTFAGQTVVAQLFYAGLFDVTAPTVLGANVNTAGTTLTIAFTEAGSAPVLPASSVTGFTLTASGGAVTLSGTAISGTTFTATTSRTIGAGETLTLAYTPGNVTDSAAIPNALASFSGTSVTNNVTPPDDGEIDSEVPPTFYTGAPTPMMRRGNFANRSQQRRTIGRRR